MNNYLQVIGDKMKKNKKTENLLTLIILFVILLIAVNYIFKEEENTESTNAMSDNIALNKGTENTLNTLENKIEEVLNKISGVSDAKVIISYANTEKINPIYDTKQDIEKNDDGSSKTTTEKNVAYEEVNGEKVAIVESKDIAKAEGAIVVFKTVGDTSHILEVKEAVSAVTGISIHKIQVFEN